MNFMAKLNEIVKFLDEYLETDKFEDGSWNGLQAEGKADIEKIIFAVDASIETIKKAIENGADMIIVHHGLFWQGINPSVKGFNKERIELLLQNKISLYASHLPLDRSEAVGNNTELLRLLGAKIKADFFKHGNSNIGWIGECERLITVKQAAEKLEAKLNARCVVLPFGKEKIKTIAVVSGGGGRGALAEALNLGADLFIGGEAVDVHSFVKDAHFNVIFAGHHATETVGLQALSKVIGRKFGTENIFIDVPTGL